MLSALALALTATCLDVSGASRTAYAVRLDDRRWSCGDDADLAAAEGGLWYRVGERTGVLRDPADIDEVKELFRPVRERDDQLDGLKEKQESKAAERLRLEDEIRRLAGKRERYAPGTEKNRAVGAELDTAETRLRTVAQTLSQLDAQAEILRDERRHDFDRARFRLSLIVERALSD